MKKEWECRKCGFLHEPENEFSWYRCKNCKTIRWPWLVWAFGGLAAFFLLMGTWALMPGLEYGSIIQDDMIEEHGPAAAMLVSAQDIISLLANGEFLQVKRLLKNSQEEPEFKKLALEMDTANSIKIAFQYQKEAQEPSPIYSIDSSELNTLSLTHRDNYRLSIAASSNDLFLYIFQKDHFNIIKRLFPDPTWSEVDNPVQSGLIYQVPPGQKEWFYLDELSSSNDESITETLYIIASPWPARDIERLYGKIHEATSQRAREDLIKKFIQRLQLREQETVNALFYKEFSFNHGR